MAYIYKVVNDINDKIYVGLTKYPIEYRFKQHCALANSMESTTKPLALAMREYGVGHFWIELIEETDSPTDRERFWIAYYKSKTQGYNATNGGEGAHRSDRDPSVTDEMIVATYLEVGTVTKTAEIHDINHETTRQILIKNGVKISSTQKNAEIKYAQPICMYSLSNTKAPVKKFISVYQAMEYLVAQSKTSAIRICDVCNNIMRVCDGERKSAYGYYWQYAGVTPSIDKVVNCIQYAIEQYDLSGNLVQSFPSSAAAAKHLISNGDCAQQKALIVQIRDVIKGKRKTCRGYIWKEIA